MSDFADAIAVAGDDIPDETFADCLRRAELMSDRELLVACLKAPGGTITAEQMDAIEAVLARTRP